MQIMDFRKKVSRVFDDNLRTLQWKNMVDYLIMFMILLSTLEVFLSTFEWGPTMLLVLRVVDIITLVFFTIEVALRIWTAPELFPASSAWKSRLKYCFSFYGVIDLLSTVPFYAQWLIPMPVSALKTLRTFRIIRLFRITRYFRSFKLLSGAISSKRHELVISTQFLVIITIILSLILYYAEHEVQPENYNNGFVSVIWAFAQYIGDPGEFAATPPLTPLGRVVACIVGIMGIAIVAVPAGIIGAGFTEALEDDKRSEIIKNNAKNLRNAFQRKMDRPTRYQIIPPFRSADDVKALLGMTTADLNEAVEYGKGFRLVNLASSIPSEQYIPDRIAIEHFPINRSYGCFIDRGSTVTIINPTAYIDVGMGNFGFYLALIGGFNYISREMGVRVPSKSFFTIDSRDALPNLSDYCDDLERLLNRPKAWGVTILSASGALEPVLPTNIHLTIGGPKGDTRFAGDDLMVHDEAIYRKFHDDVVGMMKERFDLTTDHQVYHNSNNPRLFLRKISLNEDVNNVMIRIEWDKILYDSRRILITKTFAEIMAKDFAGRDLPDNETILKKKDIGFDGYEF